MAKVFKCPSCSATNSRLYYQCKTQGWESGVCEVTNDGETEDHEVDDSGTDDCDSYVYTCRDCTEEIRESAIAGCMVEEGDEDGDDDDAPVISSAYEDGEIRNSNGHNYETHAQPLLKSAVPCLCCGNAVRRDAKLTTFGQLAPKEAARFCSPCLLVTPLRTLYSHIKRTCV